MDYLLGRISLVGHRRGACRIPRRQRRRNGGTGIAVAADTRWLAQQQRRRRPASHTGIERRSHPDRRLPDDHLHGGSNRLSDSQDQRSAPARSGRCQICAGDAAAVHNRSHAPFNLARFRAADRTGLFPERLAADQRQRRHAEDHRYRAGSANHRRGPCSTESPHSCATGSV